MGLGRQTSKAKRTKQKRAKETGEEKDRRKEADRERVRWIRENESEEKRQIRRKFARDSARKRRAYLKKKRVAAERQRRGKEIHEVVVLNEPLAMIDSHAPTHFLAAQANEDVKRVLLNEAVARASCTMEPLSTEGLILEDAIKVEPSMVEDDEAYS